MITTISLSGAAFDLSKGTEDIYILKADLPPDSVAVLYKDVHADFKIFHAMEYEGGLSESANVYAVKVPKGTEISFHSVHKPDEWPATIMELKKKWYFDIVFKVTKITDPTSEIPKNLRKENTDLSHIRSYAYLVETTATFNKYASSGDRSASYVIWYQSLIEALKQSYGN